MKNKINDQPTTTTADLITSSLSNSSLTTPSLSLVQIDQSMNQLSDLLQSTVNITPPEAIESESLPPSGLSPPVTVQNEDLCWKCRSIDFDDAFRKEKVLDTSHYDDYGAFLIELKGPLKVLRESDCLLCKLFASMGGFQEETNDNTSYLVAHSGMELFAPECNGLLLKLGFEEDATFLSVMSQNTRDYPLPGNKSDNQRVIYKNHWTTRPRECLGLVSPHKRRENIAVKSISRERYDIEFVKNCLTRCHTKHDHRCNSRSLESVGFFRLIDCQSKMIITASPNRVYAALSYVWGESASTSAVNNTRGSLSLDLKSCPKVISDSIQVALDLNIRYLWVDMYCINQLDEQDKATQIRLMNRIYENAEVTIIAAAGESPHYGLPGVSSTLRKEQPALKIGKYHIASTLPCSPEVISKSKWVTRGWTYQEGILSRRRLIFTDYQVYWECNSAYGGCCAESMKLPFDNYLKESVGSAKTARLSLFNHKMPPIRPWNFMNYVAEFSHRKLTYNEDSINALYGIFCAFEKCKWPVYHLMGIPIFPPYYETHLGGNWIRQNRITRSTDKCFLIGLIWTSAGEKAYDKLDQRERLPMFPSWSWAGWTGSVHNYAVFQPEWTEIDDAEVLIETKKGELVSFPTHEFLPEFIAQLPRNIQIITIKARTFSCSLTPPPNPYLSIRFGTTTLTTQWVQLNLDPSSSYAGVSRIFHGEPLIGILVGDVSGRTENVAALIVVEMGAVYERVGCCELRSMIQKEDEKGDTDVNEPWSYENFQAGQKRKFSKWIREGTIVRTIRLG